MIMKNIKKGYLKIFKICCLNINANLLINLFFYLEPNPPKISLNISYQTGESSQIKTV